jgi:hypothetical protein
LPLTEGIHKLLQLSSTLDLEENLIVIVGHLDIQVLCCTGIFWFTAAGAAVVRSRHSEKTGYESISKGGLREAV